MGNFIETAHQIDDYYNDLKTGQRTHITKHGIKKGILHLRLVFTLLVVYLLLPIVMFENLNIIVSITLAVFSYSAFYYVNYVLCELKRE